MVDLRTRERRAIPVAVGQERDPYSSSPTDFFEPISWSPKDRSLVVTGWRRGDHGVFLASVDGSLRKITKGRFGGWSPDGKRMVMTIGPKRAPAVAIADRKGVILKMVREGVEAGPWSPSGKEFVFFGGGRMYVMSSDGSRYRKLTNDTRIYPWGEDLRGAQWYPLWSPDGRMLAFAEDCHCVHIPEIDTTDTLVYRSGARTEPVRLGPGRPIWAPGSKRIALVRYWQRPTLTVMRPDGRGPRRGFDMHDHSVVEWSPDSRWFLLTAAWEEGELISRYRIDRRRVEELTTGKKPDFSPRGDWIAFTRSLRFCEAAFAMRLATRRIVQLTKC